MTAKSASSAAPVYAVKIWADGLDLFAEIPGSPPYVMRLSLTESGLSKALNLLRKRHAEAKAGRYKVPERMISGKRGPKPTESQRDQALAILKSMGVV